MKRDLVVAVGTSAMVLVGLAGCSWKNPGPAASSSPSANAPSASSASATPSPDSEAMNNVIITVDSKQQKVHGAVMCSYMGSRLSVGDDDMVTNTLFSAILDSEDNPTVHSLSLMVRGDIALSYYGGGNGENATATKTGKAYKINGNTVNDSVKKPFEIEFTCP
jgi:lipoprotein LpqH